MNEQYLYYEEHRALRDELHGLKKCQITFLTTSITATAALLGIEAVFFTNNLKGLIFLFPLIVLLPSSLIFFDKASTVTRIIGYYRILEGLIIGRYRTDSFVGWENALSAFRKKQHGTVNDLRKKSAKRNIAIMNTFWPSPARPVLSAPPAMPNALWSLLSGSVMRSWNQSLIDTTYSASQRYCGHISDTIESCSVD